MGILSKKTKIPISDFKCTICNLEEFRFDVRKNEYEYIVCLGCGTSMLYPVPNREFLKNFYEKYEGEGGSYIKIREQSKEDCFQTFDLNFSDLGFNLKKTSSALDIGCATGIFLEYLKKNKINAMGVDVSTEMVKRAKEKGLNASSTDLFSLSGKFDLITLWDVVEHFTDPTKALVKVNNLLEENGNLIIETPCRGIISDHFGFKWRHYNPPQHIYLFNQNALVFLLRQAGFRVVSWVRFGSGYTSGGIPPKIKVVFDLASKKLDIGDSIVVWAKKY